MLEGTTLEQLRAFRAVVERGSFSAAARKLGRVQAAVSQAVDRLVAGDWLRRRLSPSRRTDESGPRRLWIIARTSPT